MIDGSPQPLAQEFFEAWRQRGKESIHVQWAGGLQRLARFLLQVEQDRPRSLIDADGRRAQNLLEMALHELGLLEGRRI